MRKVNYTVERKDGTMFNTTSYEVATQGGNRIRKTFLTPIEDRTEEQIEKQRKRAQKIKEKFLK